MGAPFKEKQESITLVTDKTHMDLYKEWDRIEKEAKAEKEKLREEVLKSLRAKSDPWFQFSVSKKSVKLDPFLIYDWIKSKKKVPLRKLEKWATHSLSSEALDEIYMAGYINEEDIPPECYTTSGGTETIKVRAKPKED
jgi:hypothetical protein